MLEQQSQNSQNSDHEKFGSEDKLGYKIYGGFKLSRLMQ